MAVFVAIASPSGGIGKTSLALNLGVMAAERGLRTLLVDLDPAGGLGAMLARSAAEYLHRAGKHEGLFDVVMGKGQLKRAVKSTRQANLFMLFRGRADPIDVPDYHDCLQTHGTLDQLHRRLDPMADLVLLDVPAGLGGITRAALQQSKAVIVPVRASSSGMRLLPSFMRSVDAARARRQGDLVLLDVVPTMVNVGADEDVRVLAAVERGLGRPPHAVLESRPDFGLASSMGMPLAFLPARRELAQRMFERMVDTLLAFVVDGDARDPLAGRSFEERWVEALSTEATSGGATNASRAGDDVEGLSRARLDTLLSLDRFGSDAWGEFLRLCQATASADSVFVIDPQGLAVAAEGSLSNDTVENYGTRLMVAFEHARRMVNDGEVGIINVQLPPTWLTGFSFELADRQFMTLGLVAEEPISADAMQQIEAAIHKVIEEFYAFYRSADLSSTPE